MAEALSPTEILAIDLAPEAERAGVPIKEIAKLDRCSNELLAMAEQLRLVVAQMRAELHADAAGLTLSPHQIDAAFSDILAVMLGRTGWVH